MLTVSELLGASDPSSLHGGKAEELAMVGINRVLGMQTPSGGFAYWPGGTVPSPWAGTYATHMLLDAKRLGYPVPQERIDSAIGYLETFLDGKTGATDKGYGEIGDAPEAYMQYVLALAGKGRKGRIQALIDALPPAPTGELREHAYLLKAALYHAGDHRYEKDLKNPEIGPIVEDRSNGWSFYSDRRTRGLMLSTFQDLFGNDPAGEPLADLVAGGLRAKQSEWFATQELIWSVNGLGKRVKGAAKGFKPGLIVADGKELSPLADAHALRSGDRTWTLHRASERGSLALKVEDPGKGKLYLVMTSEGTKEHARYEDGGQGLSVGRSFHHLDGSTFDPASTPMSLAEMVYVEDTIQNTSGERVQNISLVDRLPAGWEIENPRLGRGNDVEWVNAESLWKADYLNLRDDRIELFGALDPGEKKKVVYAARAVTSGKFTLPPIEAEAMYDPRIWAREVGEVIRIDGPWKDFLL